MKARSGPSRRSPLVLLFREISRLRKAFGRGRWRKRKGIARVRLADDTYVMAEVHWYEAHGIGKRDMKIKEILEEL